MSASKLSPELEGVLDRFDQALTNIEDKLSPYLKNSMKETTPTQKSMDNAKLNLAYGYTLNTLFYMYLKTQGVSPAQHPVKRELDRVKRYMGKTMQAEKDLEQKQTKGNGENIPNEKEQEKEATAEPETIDNRDDDHPETPKKRKAETGANRTPSKSTTKKVKSTGKRTNKSKRRK